MEETATEFRRVLEAVTRVVLASVLAALTGVLAQAMFYVGPVPYTMQNTGVILSGLLLPPKYAFLSQALYLFLIAVGLPVAAGFRGGISALVSYTGGYLAGFPVASALMSFLSRWYLRRVSRDMGSLNRSDFIALLLLSLVSVLPVYILGFAVFTYYALQSEKLFSWAQKAVSFFGIYTESRILVLFIASVAIFVPQDLLMDHVTAITLAYAITKFLRSRGLRVV